jgi:hypothetical protein
MRIPMIWIAIAVAALSLLARLTPAQETNPFGRVERLAEVGDPVGVPGRLSFFAADPWSLDRDVSLLRGVTDDGSMVVADYAGTALLRLDGRGQGRPQLLLDSTRRDPVDGVGLCRLLRVETNAHGVSAVLALRADGTRGIYRLDRGSLTRLALLPAGTVRAELAIDDDLDAIAYVAPVGPGPDQPLALFQKEGARTAELLRQGQLGVAGAVVEGFGDLTSSRFGALALLVSLRRPDGTPMQAVVGKSNLDARFWIAKTGDPGTRGPLTALLRPRIGPEGTVVFFGIESTPGSRSSSGTCFAARPGGAGIQPMLRQFGWSTDPATFDYAIASDGTIALRAALGVRLWLVLVSRDGAVLGQATPLGGRNPEPVGRPAFGPGGGPDRLFFLGRDSRAPADRNGRIPVGLYRFDARGFRDQALVTPGQPVPGRPGARFLGLTQQPVVAQDAVVFGALFSGAGPSAVPTAGLFRVSPEGAPAEVKLVAEEGAELPGTARVALLRDLAYLDDETLVVGGQLPGSGPLLARVAAGRITIRSGRKGTISSVLAVGQPLDPPSRRLIAAIGPPVTLDMERQLLLARYSQDGGAPQEGLFTVRWDGRVEAVGTTEDAVTGWSVAGFGEFTGEPGGTTYVPYLPRVSPDRGVAFKARLARDRDASAGVLQWAGAGMAIIGLANPAPDNLAVLPGDRPPYALERWAAGPSGQIYFTAKTQSGRRSLFRGRGSAGASATSVEKLVVPGRTTMSGPESTPLVEMSDFMVDRAGEVYVSGTTAIGAGLFRLETESPGPIPPLRPLVLQGASLPVPLDGTDVRGFVFDGRFELMGESTKGALLFRAGIAKPGTDPRWGLFRRDAGDRVRTIMVENLEILGERRLSFSTLATSPGEQTANGMVAYATQKKGHWAIWRWRPGRTTQVAEEGQPLPGGTHLVSLNAGPVLDPGSAPRAVFSLNDAGDVAFLASDGHRWGIYRFTDRR